MRVGWLQPDWPAPARVHAVCSTRAGGASPAPYDGLNLGDHVGDAPELVAANRAALRAALGARPVFLEQVHGWQVAQLDAATSDGIVADGCVTTERNVACAIMAADCLPVLFASTQGQAVAAAHAGWRGLAGDAQRRGQGVLEVTWRRFAALVDADSQAAASRTLVWLGPCIGPEAFEVGPEVKAAFEAHDAGAAALFKPHGPGKWLADLPRLARHRLQALGISRFYGNDGSHAWCTVSNPSRFFSHRRDRVSGRMVAAIWLA